MDKGGRVELAEGLVNEVIRLARHDDHKALLAIDADPTTEALFGMLREQSTAQARVHLKAARVWRTRQNEKARDKFAASSKALDQLDMALAKGILRKIDVEILEPANVERYDELLLAITARRIELEEIEGRFPDDPPEEKRRFKLR